MINQNYIPETRILDPPNVPCTHKQAKPANSIIRAYAPDKCFPHNKMVRSERDLEQTPEIDPNLEVPLLEAQIEAMFQGT